MRRILPAVLALLAACGTSAAQRRRSLEAVPPDLRRSYDSAAARVRAAGVVLELRTSFTSGILVDPDGTIVTCSHGRLWLASAMPIRVVFSDGRRGLAKLLGSSERGDVSVFRVIEPAGPFPAVPLGREIKAGEWVFLATPSPPARGADLTGGRVLMVGEFCANEWNRGEMMMIEAPSFPGDSGAPALNGRGEVVGVLSRSLMFDAVLGEWSLLSIATTLPEIQAVLAQARRGMTFPEQVHALFNGFRWNPEVFDLRDRERLSRYYAAIDRLESAFLDRWKGRTELAGEMALEAWRAVEAEVRRLKR